MKRFFQSAAVLLWVLFFSVPFSTAQAQGTAFTYQGRLNRGAVPANGTYDLTFTLFASPTNDWLAGSTVTNAATTVANGLFTVTVDFGNVFSGDDLWLEIGVRTNGSGNFTNLVPRQWITATPYAVRAANAAVAQSAITVPDGAISSFNLLDGAATTRVVADGAITAQKMAVVTKQYPPITITNPFPQAQGNFGCAMVAVGSDRFIIGAQGNPPGGAAYLYGLDGTRFATYSDPTVGPNAFGCAMALVGNDRVLIGANFQKSGALFPGAAFLFNTNGTLLTTFTNPVVPTQNSYFGCAVAALGKDRVLIGAHNVYVANQREVGAVYLFNTNGTLLTTFTNPTPYNPDEFFGFTVAALGSDRVIISAYGDNDNYGGSVYMYNTNGTLLSTWGTPYPGFDLGFGYTMVPMGNDKVFIGSQSSDTVYLFSTNGTVLASFIAPFGGGVSDRFGSAVAVMGEQVLIGAPLHYPGLACLYNLNTSLIALFTNAAPIPSTTQQFGSPLTWVGNHMLIGASLNDTGATHAGTAYLLSQDTYVPDLVADGVRSGTITADSLADGAVTAAKINGVLLPGQIPNLNASKITSGTFTGDGGGLTNVSVSGITSNQLEAATWQLATNVNGGRAALATNVVSGINITNAFITNSVLAGDGGGLTNLTTSANYIYALDQTTQPVVAPSVLQDITFNNAAQISGWTYSPGTATFTNTQPGLYLVEYTAEVLTTAGTATVLVAGALNGVPVAGSQTSVFLAAANLTIPVSKSFLVNVPAAGVLKLNFMSNTTSARLIAGVSPASPTSVTLTVVRIR